MPTRRISGIKQLASALLLAFAFPAIVAFAGEPVVFDHDSSNVWYGVLMAGFANRNLDDFDESVKWFVESTLPDDVNRIKIMMALAKLGKPEAENALATLEEWEGNYPKKVDDQYRRSCIADLNLYYLDQPEKAAELYKQLIAEKDVRTPLLLSALFTIYSGHRRMRDPEMMERYLDEMEKVDSPQFFQCLLVFMAAKGEKDKARKGVTDLEASMPPEYEVVAKVYTAPIWGYLGDLEKVIGNLEPGLKEQSISYAPGGFRLYCDWVRQSPAYNSIREDQRFSDMWDRLYAFEPESRGGTILIPRLGGKNSGGGKFIPEAKKK